MRIHLQTTPNKEVVPYDYQQKLIGSLHKWLGENDLHDRISLYSFSWLQNGMMVKDGYTFRKGARWFISFYEDEYLMKIIRTILSDPDMFAGLRVTDISIQNTPDFRQQEYFKLASPVFIKRRIEGRGNQFYTFENEECGRFLTETLKHKMEIAGLPDDDTLAIRFDSDYPKKKVKKVRIHGIDNKCNMCPVFINGKPATKAFAWSVGLGNMTGSGFGSLY